MADKALTKSLLRGPISALHRLGGDCEGEDDLVLWGSGGNLHVWSRQKARPWTASIFDACSIHGIKSVHTDAHPRRIVMFGSKAFAIVDVALDDCAIRHQGTLDDWVLDCCVVEDRYLVAACAHNMIDMLDLSLPSGSGLIGRHRCPYAAVLCSMSIFSVDRGIVRIASGSVFGHLQVWQCSTGGPVAGALDGTGSIIACAKRHEGVIFRITWNRAGDKLITASDDRTVRLWELNEAEASLTQLFEGWGHICRIWDAVFVDSSEAEVATCSEDGTVRLWNQAGQCSAILSGHIDSVWRLISLRNGRCLASVGNDSAVKFWPLAHHRVCSPADEDSMSHKLNIPSWIRDGDSAIADGSSSASQQRRANGVNSLTFSACGHLLVVVLIDGGVWAVSTHRGDNALPAPEYIWSSVTSFPSTVITSNATTVQVGAGFRLQLVAAFLDGQCSYRDIEVVPVAGAPGSFQPNLAVELLWSPHSTKCVNLWLLADFPQMRTSGETLVCSSTVKGACAIWQVESRRIVRRIALNTFRQEIASSVFLMNSSTCVLGDSRGGITIHTLSGPGMSQERSEQKGDEEAAEDSWEICATQYFHKVHKTDPVACIASNGLNSFVSAGHDATVSFFAKSAEKRWELQNSMSTHPIHTPDQFFLRSTCSLESPPSLIVGGFHGSSYLVVDLIQSYQFCRIEGGGWKRPHRFWMQENSACDVGDTHISCPPMIFACPVPIGKNITQLQVCATPWPSLEDRKAGPHPLQLQSSCFGRVSYCSVVLHHPDAVEGDSIYSGRGRDAGLLVAGGEDCTLKVFCLPSAELLQVTTLSKNSSLKVLVAAKSQSKAQRGLVLGAGGKLLYYLYAYDLANSDSPTPLKAIASGTVWPHATQDHRILSARCSCWGMVTSEPHCRKERYLLLLGDSRGVLTVLSLDYAHDASLESSPLSTPVHRLYEVALSTCPLLSMSSVTVRLGGQLFADVCVAGDTKGLMHVWMCPFIPHGENSDIRVLQPEYLLGYKAHAMGSNAADILVHATVEGANDLIVSSGGDDQGLCVQRLTIHARRGEDEEGWEIAGCLTGPSCTLPSAAGAAMKGASYIPSPFGSYCLATVAYDQRVSLWRISVTDRPNEARTLDGLRKLEWLDSSATVVVPGEDSTNAGLSVRWEDGCMVNIAEISSLSSTSWSESEDEARTVIVVIGQGFQLLHHRSRLTRLDPL